MEYLISLAEIKLVSRHMADGILGLPTATSRVTSGRGDHYAGYAIGAPRADKDSDTGHLANPQRNGQRWIGG